MEDKDYFKLCREALGISLQGHGQATLQGQGQATLQGQDQSPVNQDSVYIPSEYLNSINIQPDPLQTLVPIQSQCPSLTQRISSNKATVQKSTTMTHNESSIRRLLVEDDNVNYSEEKVETHASLKSDVSLNAVSDMVSLTAVTDTAGTTIKTEENVDYSAIRKMLIQDELQIGLEQNASECPNIKTNPSVSDNSGKHTNSIRKMLALDKTWNELKERGPQSAKSKGDMRRISGPPIVDGTWNELKETGDMRRISGCPIKSEQVVDIMFKLLTEGSVTTRNDGFHVCPFLKHLENMQASISKITISALGQNSEFELSRCKEGTNVDNSERSAHESRSKISKKSVKKQPVSTNKQPVSTKSEPVVTMSQPLTVMGKPISNENPHVTNITHSTVTTNLLVPANSIKGETVSVVCTPLSTQESHNTDSKPIKTEPLSNLNLTANEIIKDILKEETSGKVKECAEATGTVITHNELAPAKKGSVRGHAEMAAAKNDSVKGHAEITPVKKNMTSFRWKMKNVKSATAEKMKKLAIRKLRQMEKDDGKNVKKVKKKKKKESKRGEYLCEKCNKTWINLASYKKHLLTHDNPPVKKLHWRHKNLSSSGRFVLMCSRLYKSC